MIDPDTKDKKTLGQFGEDTAVKFLKSKGYAIKSRNFRCRFGEIDIIAEDSKYLAFVEVKLRKDSSHGTAGEFVSPIKQNKLRKAAGYYLAVRDTQLQPRFDVVEVYTPYGIGGKVYVRHITDAFF